VRQAVSTRERQIKEMGTMKIAIGADHGGFELKQTLAAKLRHLGHEVIDLGTDSAASVDYPDFADQVCGQVLDNKAQCGILVCGTGIGMSMAANRYRGIRAALCDNEFSARMSREHNNANVLCLGDRVLGKGLAESIVEVWLSASFTGGRHQRRVDKFSG
jgi:ribose 5-phosphate isomerase B